ncbi:MAG TPA: matrixin family metalloprotease [Polyangiaceae bacterium]|nr:matrixin family metalloprotease [Polyangiaceae bacterium]
MSESLDPLRLSRRPLAPPLTSLMNAATARSVQPRVTARSRVSVRPRKRHQALKIVALVAVSAAVGLVGSENLSHLRARTTPLMNVISGNPALKQTSDGEHVRWHAPKSKIYFDASLDAAGPHAREAIQLGFGTWLDSGAKLPSLDFDSTHGARFGRVPNGKSEIMYGPITLAGHENDLALTVTFSDPKTGEVVESDMIFNDRHPFGILSSGEPGTRPGADAEGGGCGQRYDLQSVATHEAGHFFGLGEDFEEKPATMYYTTGRCETNKRALGSSDAKTMNALYLAAPTQAAADDADPDLVKGCGGARIGQGQTGGTAPLLSMLGLLGFVAYRRRRH